MLCHGDNLATVPQANFQENGRSDAAMFARVTINCDANIHVTGTKTLRGSDHDAIHLPFPPCTELRVPSNAYQNVSMRASMPFSYTFLVRIMEEASINHNICMKSWPAGCQGCEHVIAIGSFLQIQGF